MTLSNKTLLDYLNQLLQPQNVRDYCPNGLQVEGKEHVSKIVCGVTASQALIDRAILHKADAIFVHHGFFWKGENDCIQGMKRKRIKALLDNDINLYAYHLPLDIHPQFGNNAQLGQLLGIQDCRVIDPSDKQCVVMRGETQYPTSAEDFADKVEKLLGRKPLLVDGGGHQISTIAWCTGGGQGYIEQAAEKNIDAFVSGEISEQTVHTAREMGIHFIAAGHHATERYGAKAIANHLQEQFNCDAEFFDIDNPA